jgi:hypothetical protein
MTHTRRQVLESASALGAVSLAFRALGHAVAQLRDGNRGDANLSERAELLRQPNGLAVAMLYVAFWSRSPTQFSYFLSIAYESCRLDA